MQIFFIYNTMTEIYLIVFHTYFFISTCMIQQSQNIIKIIHFFNQTFIISHTKGLTSRKNI